MADYTGSDERLKYLFQHGGGGGGSASLAGLSDVSLSSPSDGQVLKYDANAQEWVNSNESGGGGGIVNDGTVGVKIDVTIPASGSQTYTYAELGITKKGYYLIGCCSSHAETNGGWKYLGYLSYSGQYVSNYQSSYIKVIDSYYTSVTLNESAETVTFYNTSSGWGMTYRIEVLPLHPKIEVEKHTYSATEQVVGTWIDGKPIYEKTVDCGYFQNTTSTQYFNHGISDLEIVIDTQAFMTNGSASANIPFHGTAGDGVSIWIESTRIGIVTQSNRSSYKAYVTLRYTKSTT